jgi:hypothetical protein
MHIIMIDRINIIRFPIQSFKLIKDLETFYSSFQATCHFQMMTNLYKTMVESEPRPVTT